jgi:hypothetical protein
MLPNACCMLGGLNVQCECHEKCEHTFSVLVTGVCQNGAYVLHTKASVMSEKSVACKLLKRRSWEIHSVNDNNKQSETWTVSSSNMSLESGIYPPTNISNSQVAAYQEVPYTFFVMCNHILSVVTTVTTPPQAYKRGLHYVISAHSPVPYSLLSIFSLEMCLHILKIHVFPSE